MCPAENPGVSPRDLERLQARLDNTARSTAEIPTLPPHTETLFDHFFELSPGLLALADMKTQTWIRINPAFTAILGWSEQDVMQRPFFDIVHPGDLQRSQLAVARLLTGHRLVNFEQRVQCKDGGYRWIVWDSALFAREGVIFCIGRDVTRKRQKLKTLRAANQRMQRLNETLEQFASTAGHDLQEPLRTLSMYSNLLMRGYWGELPDGMREFLLTISSATARMQALVQNLLQYAHISDAKEIEEKLFKTVPLEEVLKQVLAILKPAIDECSATITHDPLPEVRGDDIQLSQLLQNLLSNSLKYRCQGRPVRIHVGAERQGEEWQLHVTDNGVGFEAEYSEHIFEPFKRLHGYDDIPGTGLGLAICRKILFRHGGRIWAESQFGEGATFWFTLPRRDASPYSWNTQTEIPAAASVASSSGTEHSFGR